MLSLGKAQFWRNANPTGAIADFVEVWRQAGARRWPFVALAFTTTLGIFSVIAQESWRGPPAKPEIIYINSWTADRTDAQIARENLANQKLQERLAAEQAARDAKVKDIYRTLARVSGMDVAAIEQKARADEAAEKAAHAKAIGLDPEPAASESAPVGQP
ncbi:MAG: hypothetical protein FP826_08150 [Sphingomonadales bacterium]|nr:hypothetical protein [Sphingomonadales bacterium]MBU3993474.1 hypothetical protein [Alphaproteobacteria bacterium]